MSDYNNISDSEIRSLLKKRLLEQADDNLLEAEAKMVFASEALIVPSTAKEEELIKKLTKTKFKLTFKKWILPSASVITILSVLTYYTFNKTNLQTASTIKNKLFQRNRAIKNFQMTNWS